MREYITGWVKVGSSVSLWPWFAVADQVDDDVALETLAEADRELDSVYSHFWIIGIYMEDRGFDDACDVGGVACRSGRFGGCGEADLIVDDEVNRPAGKVAGQMAQEKGFGNYSLSDEGRIPMDENRNDATSFLVAQ